MFVQFFRTFSFLSSTREDYKVDASFRINEIDIWPCFVPKKLNTAIERTLYLKSISIYLSRWQMQGGGMSGRLLQLFEKGLNWTTFNPTKPLAIKGKRSVLSH